MNKCFTVVLFVACSILVGCATPAKKMSREEYLKTTTRTYEGIDKEKLISAIEEVFNLSDPEDIQIVHSPNGIRIIRPWLIYMVLAASQGTDNWNFELIREGEAGLAPKKRTRDYAAVNCLASYSVGV